MTEQQLRDIFAEELVRESERTLAKMVRSGHDNSHGGTAAMAAMRRVAEAAVAEERERLDKHRELLLREPSGHGVG